MIGLLKSTFAHPRTRGIDLDDPSLTLVRRRIVQEKPFLRAIYEDWYRWIVQSLPPGNDPVLEIGSGPGFLADYIPDLVTSEVYPCEGVREVVDALRLPFASGALRAIVMTDVLHHIPNVAGFLREAERTLRPEGAILMVEPWNTAFARFVYGTLHHEPFEPYAERWELPTSGPLSGANSALPWIVFHRDRDRFAREFPLLEVRGVEPFMPLRYFVSGGVSMRSLQPGWAVGFWRVIEALLSPWRNQLAMFAKVDVRHK